MNIYKITFTLFKKRVWRFLLIVYFLLMAPACRDVQANQLAGMWTIRDSSRSFLPIELRNAKSQIVLDQSGIFVASDIPGIFYFPGRDFPELDSGKGSWRLVSSEGKQQVQLDFYPVDRGGNNLPFGTQLDVVRGWSNLNLVYFLVIQMKAKKLDLKNQNSWVFHISPWKKDFIF